MKCVLSGNKWQNSSWDGVSKYEVVTKEATPNGDFYEIKAEFRKYQSINQSIADHSAYLLSERYTGVKSCLDYKRAIYEF